MHYLLKIIFASMRCRVGLAAVLSMYSGWAAAAVVVESRLPAGVIGRAEFWAGKPTAPAVLMVHGFLQTSSFPTLHRLAEALADNGYTVLAPTLALGISRREKSLSCEAAHAHTMEADIREIAHWANWLVARGYRAIVLIGHSSGAVQALAYVDGVPQPAVKKVVAASLMEMRVADAERARAQVQDLLPPGIHDTRRLDSYSLSYCDNYVASPASFRSYTAWSNARILTALSEARVPVDVIMGAGDPRMEDGWLDRLKESGAQVTVIPAASHFFGGEQEFEFTEAVEISLQPLNAAN